jgi:hypothetical protein
VNELTTQPIEPDSIFAVPSIVLQTAVAAAGNGTALTAATWQDDTKLRFMVLLYFADFQNTQFRQFDIYLDENRLVPVRKSYSPSYLSSSSVYVESYRATDGKYSITLVRTNNSVLPPMINALEIYVRVPCETPTTLPQDCKSISINLSKIYSLNYYLVSHLSKYRFVCFCVLQHLFYIMCALYRSTITLYFWLARNLE